MGLNYGKTLRLQKEFGHLKQTYEKERQSHGVRNIPSPKPTMADLSQLNPEMKQLYYAK
jgi:hypothetical protein